MFVCIFFLNTNPRRKKNRYVKFGGHALTFQLQTLPGARSAVDHAVEEHSQYPLVAQDGLHVDVVVSGRVRRRLPNGLTAIDDRRPLRGRRGRTGAPVARHRNVTEDGQQMHERCTSNGRALAEINWIRPTTERRLFNRDGNVVRPIRALEDVCRRRNARRKRRNGEKKK